MVAMALGSLVSPAYRMSHGLNCMESPTCVLASLTHAGACSRGTCQRATERGCSTRQDGSHSRWRGTHLLFICIHPDASWWLCSCRPHISCARAPGTELLQLQLGNQTNAQILMVTENQLCTGEAVYSSHIRRLSCTSPCHCLWGLLGLCCRVRFVQMHLPEHDAPARA